MWLFLRRAGGADVKFHADRRNFCRREYILCMKRTITVSIVRSCTVKSRSPPPRESYTICSFMVGRRQLVTSSSSPPKEPIVQLLQCDEFSSTTPLSLSLPLPLYRSFTTTKFADRWTIRAENSSIETRKEKKSAYLDRKQPEPRSLPFSHPAVIWIQQFVLEMDWNRAKSLFI